MKDYEKIPDYVNYILNKERCKGEFGVKMSKKSTKCETYNFIYAKNIGIEYVLKYFNLGNKY